MSINNPIQRAVHCALVAAAASAAINASTVHAQTSPEAIQEVIVTGSRISRPDYEAASPVVSISAETFELSGEVQIESVLNSMPQLVAAITTTSNNPSNGGQANVDLRGLGTSRTLVLMDGSRLVPSNVTGVVDLNTIPSALIDGVEILTGGASSVYGSDAIAGVVNVRMKRDFSGLQLKVQQNVTSESDGRTTLVEGVMGGNFADDRGNAVVALTYDKRDEVLSGSRKFSSVGRSATLAPSGSTTVPDGSLAWGTNAPNQAALDQVFGGYGGSPGQVTSAATLGFNPDGTLFSFGRNSAAQPVINYRGNTSDPGYNPLSYSYNFSPVNYLQLPLERRQIAAFATYNAVPDTVEVYSRMMFTTYNADQQLAATPVTCANATIPGCLVPFDNAALSADMRYLLSQRANPTAPFTFNKRTLEVGPRYAENNYDVMQGLLGVRGDLKLFDNDYQWDVFGSWGRTRNVTLQDGNVSRSRLQAGLNNAGAYAARGCALFNPFGDGSLTRECAAAIAIRASNVLEYELTQFVGSFSGPLVDLWAGSVDFAIGAEYREEVANFRPDEFLASGDVVGFNAQQPVDGRITVTEPFVEVAVPLLSDLPFAQSVGLELGYRNSDYNLAGKADTYKTALQWKPIDSLKVRGSYNRAIRAPNINDLFLPQQESFPQYSDPCNATSSFRTGANAAQVAALCQAQGIPAASLATFAQPNPQARSFIGGNLDLKPEEADTYTFGLAWQSRGDLDLSVSVDYFKYEIENVITSLTASSIIGRCFNQLGTNPNFDANNAACQLFTRNPANFGVTDVVTTQLNLAARKVDGIDLNLDYGLLLPVGRLDFRLAGTYLMSWEQQETSADPYFDRAGTISQTVASAFPEYKANFATSYTWNDFLFRYNLRYIDGMDVVNNDATLTPSTSAKPSVPTYLYHDLTARWNANEMFGITVGVLNAADKDPPIYTTNAQAGIQSNTDPSTYDVLGRRYFANFTMKF